MWHRVAPALAERSQRRADGPARPRRLATRAGESADHALYSKREMAADALAVMRHCGFERFEVCAHDRGARVAHRLALDHPQAVQRLMLLDIAPTLAMYEDTSEAFARAYWHWFFLIQPAPLPERAIEADPAAWIREGMGRALRRSRRRLRPRRMAEYERCIAIPGSATAVCEDYRASATHRPRTRPRRSRGRPPRRLRRCACCGARRAWSSHCFDVLALWRDAATRRRPAARSTAATTSPRSSRRRCSTKCRPSSEARHEQQEPPHRRHRRRRHRQGSHARGRARARRRGAPLRHRARSRPLRLRQLRLLRAGTAR